MFFILLIFYICYYSQNFMMEIWLKQEEYALCENVFSLHHANHQRLKRLISVSMLREVIISYSFLDFFKIFYYYYYFLLYNIVLVLPYINMHPLRVYMCSPSWTPLPPPSPYHPSGSSQCTNPKLPVSCIKPGLTLGYLIFYIHLFMKCFHNSFIIML